MKKKKDIININNKRLLHGYQERYEHNLLYFRGTYKNRGVYGYVETIRGKATRFYIR